MIKNHRGITVDSDVPITGVVTNHRIAHLRDVLHDESAIDLAWEEHQCNCMGECSVCHCNHQDGPPEKNGCDCNSVHDSEDERWYLHQYQPEGEHGRCSPESGGDRLIGSWKKDAEGKYEPNQEDPKKLGYAAVVGEVYTQVVWSKTTTKTRLSSRFPGQGNLGNEGKYLTDDLPAGMYGSTKKQSSQT